jgi:hypothetical protein
MTTLRQIVNLTAVMKQWQAAQHAAVEGLTKCIEAEDNAERNYTLRKARRLLKMGEIGDAIKALDDGEWEP